MACREGILKVGAGLEEASSELEVGLHPRKMALLKRTINTEKTFCFISEILPPIPPLYRCPFATGPSLKEHGSRCLPLFFWTSSSSSPVYA
jgi:hypothetical protein